MRPPVVSRPEAGGVVWIRRLPTPSLNGLKRRNSSALLEAEYLADRSEWHLSEQGSEFALHTVETYVVAEAMTIRHSSSGLVGIKLPSMEVENNWLLFMPIDPPDATLGERQGEEAKITSTTYGKVHT